MKQHGDPQVAPETADVPNQKRRIRWSAPSPASNKHRPSLSLISGGRSRQKPIGPSWVGLIR